jgi:LuxR family glucitol operon transcriptional activator
MFDAAQGRRKREGLSSVPHSVGPLLPYLDFQDGFQLIMRLGTDLPQSISSGMKEVGPGIMRAVPVRNRVAHNRPLEIDDLPTVMDLAEELTGIQGWDWSSLNRTLSEIRKDPGYIFRVSASLPVDPDTTVANNLPAPDFDETSLLGRKEECRSLHRALRGSWPVISILGDGGIGKTALALQVCYELSLTKNALSKLSFGSRRRIAN